MQVNQHAYWNILRPNRLIIDRQKLAWVLDPTLAFVITRLVLCVAALIGNLMLPTDPGHWDPAPGNTLLGLTARWDSQWYDWIVKEGYWLRPGERSNIAFFPMYPLTIKLIMPFVGNNTVLAGVLVSNLAFLLTLVVLYKLVELEYGSRGTARRAVFYLALFPTSFFFSMMYSESLFLLFVVTAVYFARQKLWAWATLMGLLASATRIVGVFTWGIVMWEWLWVHGWTLARMHHLSSWRNLWQGLRQDWFQVLIISAIPLGLLSYMVFLHLNFNDPVAFSTVQSAWGRVNVGFWAVIARDMGALLSQGASLGNIARFLNLSTLLLFLGISLAVWRRLGAGYAIYIILALLIPTTSASQSIIRYALVCFPVFMVAGDWGRNEFFDRVWMTGSAMLLGVLTAVSVNWIFVA